MNVSGHGEARPGALAGALSEATVPVLPAGSAPVAAGKTGRAGGEAIGIEAIGMGMRFGNFAALEDVSLTVRPGSFHALLGENGAGKSTLVKCLMGFYRPTAGEIVVNDREVDIPNPRVAQALGLGMVYQHFTLVPSLTGAENLVIARGDAPAVIDWAAEHAALERFMRDMPFRIPLDRPVRRLSAGEKQKLEIVKQLYLGGRFLILDEPTSVLTPGEADEVLGHVRALTEQGSLSVLMITHKFREVTAYADDVTVLRRGRHAGGGRVRDLTSDALARMMVGEEIARRPVARAPAGETAVLSLRGLRAEDRSGRNEIAVDALDVRAGEIVGIAGVSGNGQMELMEVLAGQRPARAGTIRVGGADFAATRRQMREAGVRCLPEEPMRNASAPAMSVAENLAFRLFDTDAAMRPAFWLDLKAMRRRAGDLIGRFGIKTASMHAPIRTLSGGNVQRTVLARELTGEVALLLVANPCFGLDFAAVADIRGQLVAARNAGTAILLISEDLDEILELADRILVMSEGRIAFECGAAAADVQEIGRHMAGHAA